MKYIQKRVLNRNVIDAHLVAQARELPDDHFFLIREDWAGH